MCLALPGQIDSVSDDGPLRMGQVRFGTARREVCLEHVPEAGVGDWVIVHVGFAIQQLDEEAARRAIALFEEAGQA